ncbi:hypothetical protein ACHHYP_08465 [Achlya hypogyna]|uniref:Uncharacterized protein n=1 Tax=Achlya hypogyna TaxID=1202772 RepID=A0A1V9YPL2_ACHHY|nr:hypothetical protein ACHHYP_08465 [Achlya hypogyna]
MTPKWTDPFVVANVAVALAVLSASVVSPWKYTRVTGRCSSNWIDIRFPDNKPICCDETNHAPCYAGMGLVHDLTSGYGAWFLPIVAVVVNLALTTFLPTVSDRHATTASKRFCLYVSLMAYRTVVLYGGLNLIEKWLFPPEATCWYARLRRNKRCIDPFDHADHIVLFITHFVAIAAFEWKILQRDPSVSSLKRTCLQAWLGGLFALSLYAIFHTAYSFHSLWENVVALAIGQSCVMFPLFLVSEDQLPLSWLRLDQFLAKRRVK